MSVRNSVNGLSNSKEYRAWHHMKFRCNNKNYNARHLYGGRGIKVCKRWLESFNNFYKDMGSKPSPDHSLDRIDNNKGYSPKNCRWATKKEQGFNRRSTRKITINGETKCLLDWCKHYDVIDSVVLRKIQRGYEPIEALKRQRPRRKKTCG